MFKIGCVEKVSFYKPQRAASLCKDKMISEGSRELGGKIRKPGLCQLADTARLGSKTEPV